MTTSETRKPLTPPQARCLEFVTTYAAKHDGFMPTMKEIAAGIGVNNRAMANQCSRALEKKGYIRRAQVGGRSLSRVEIMAAPSPL